MSIKVLYWRTGVERHVQWSGWPLHVGRDRANWFCRQCSGGCSSNMDVRQYGNEIIDTINHKPEGNDQREVDFKVEFGLIAGERS